MWDGLVAIYEAVSAGRWRARGSVEASRRTRTPGGPASAAHAHPSPPLTTPPTHIHLRTPTHPTHPPHSPTHPHPPTHATHPSTHPTQGLVEAVGLSNYGPQQLARISAYLQKRGVPLAAVQVRVWGG